MTRMLARDFGTSLRMGATTLVTVAGTTPAATNALTICFWYNPDYLIRNAPAGTSQRIIRTNDDAISVFQRQTSGNLEFKLTTTQGNTPRPTVSDRYLIQGVWHFVVIQYDTDSDAASIYVDGTLLGTQARDGTALIHNNTWVLGDATDALRGFLDEVAVYNVAFTAQERDDAYYKGIYPEAGQVFYYKFDEGSGTSLTDSSGNGKTGTITNGAFSTNVAMHARTLAANRPAAFRFRGRTAVSPDIDCHQGIATDGTYFYGIDSNAIRKFDSNWNLIAQNTNAGGNAGVNHLGDGAVYNGRLYCAAENYTSPTVFSDNRIAVFNTSTLAFIEQHDISAQGVETAGAAIDPAQGLIYVCTYTNGDRINVYDLTTFDFVRTIMLPVPLPKNQGITYKNQRLYLAEDTNKRIYTLNMQGDILGYTRVSSGTQEGIDFTTNIFYSLEETPVSGANQIVSTIMPYSARQPLNANLVFNGDFEIAPSFTAVTTGNKAWIDGTAAGQTFGDTVYSWATNKPANANSSASFDSTVKYSGSNSMKLSTVATGAWVEVAPYLDDASNASHARYSTPVEPNTSYTCTFRMKTNYTSGDATNGAYMTLRVFDRNGAGLTQAESTKVKTTTDWTEYSVTISTPATGVFLAPRKTLYGHQGTGTLIMDAWYDDIIISRTTPITRTAA